MEFLLLICNDPTGEEYSPAEDNIAEWVDEVSASGARLTGNRLHPAGQGEERAAAAWQSARH